LIEARLDRLAARVIQTDRLTFYQIERPSVRRIMEKYLKTLQDRFNKPLYEVDEKQLRSTSEYQAVLKLIRDYGRLQKEIWKRGVVDYDPKILDNYGAYEYGNSRDISLP